MNLELFKFDTLGFFFGIDEFKIFFSGGDTFVAYNLGNNIDRNAGFELVDNESVAKIVDFNTFNVGFIEKAIEKGTNVSGKKTTTGFGDKNIFGGRIVATFVDVFFEGLSG